MSLQDKQVMMSVPEGDFTGQVMLTLMREILEGQRATTIVVNDVANRLTAIENSRIDARLAAAIDDNEDIEARLKSIEDEQQRRTGALQFVGWLKDYTPWLFAIAAFLYVALTQRARP